MANTYTTYKNTPFLKIGDKYLPLALVYSSGTGLPKKYDYRLFKFWGANLKNDFANHIVQKILYTEKEILDLVKKTKENLLLEYSNNSIPFIEKGLTDDEVLKQFGEIEVFIINRGELCDTTFKKFEKLVEYGIKNAIDINHLDNEDRSAMDLRFSIDSYIYTNGKRINMPKSKVCCRIFETEEVINEYEKLLLIHHHNGIKLIINFKIYLNLDYDIGQKLGLNKKVLLEVSGQSS